jgi:hypothetical protein
MDGVPVREYLGDVLPRLGIGVRGPDGERGGGTHAVGMGQTENVLAVFRKRSFLSVWPVRAGNIIRAAGAKSSFR